MVIAVVIRFKNNQVIVFDSTGEQISEYQGRYENVKEGILRDAPGAAVFAHGLGSSGRLLEVPRGEW